MAISRFVLVGHSFAGTVLSDYAGRHPEKLAALVYVDAVGDASNAPAEIKEYFRKQDAALTPQKLRYSAMLGLANEMGSELSGIHGQALRRSVTLPPRKDYLTSRECDEAHACGEVLVAAVLNAYLAVWINRLQAIGDTSKLDRKRTAEEGAEIADRFLK